MVHCNIIGWWSLSLWWCRSKNCVTIIHDVFHILKRGQPTTYVTTCNWSQNCRSFINIIDVDVWGKWQRKLSREWMYIRWRWITTVRNMVHASEQYPFFVLICFYMTLNIVLNLKCYSIQNISLDLNISVMYIHNYQCLLKVKRYNSMKDILHCIDHKSWRSRIFQYLRCSCYTTQIGRSR